MNTSLIFGGASGLVGLAMLIERGGAGIPALLLAAVFLYIGAERNFWRNREKSVDNGKP